MPALLRRCPAERAVDMLPRAMGEEIRRLASGRLGGFSAISELRLRLSGACCMQIGRERLRLTTPLNRLDMDGLIDRLTEGALYAHRDSIASGYISLGDGIRVGVCGRAAYDGDRLVGVGELDSLVFRIPTGECDFADRLYEIYKEGIGQGMLIYSPPGVGKTTALRTLASMIGGGDSPRRVAVVDERCEFSSADYTGCEVDILKGYKRRSGVEIATRTLSPELIMIDEIGADDGEALLSVVRCGLPLIATAHAASRDELFSRPPIRALLDLSVFSVLLGISKGEEGYTLTPERL